MPVKTAYTDPKGGSRPQTVVTKFCWLVVLVATWYFTSEKTAWVIQPILCSLNFSLHHSPVNIVVLVKAVEENMQKRMLHIL